MFKDVILTVFNFQQHCCLRKVVTLYNLNNLSILHTDENMKKIFPSKPTKTLCRREKNVKEVLSFSLLPVKPKNSESCITSCKKCDICNNDLITENKFLSVKLLVGFIMSQAICLVTAVMLFTWFHVKSVKINTQDQPLISRPDLEFITVT